MEQTQQGVKRELTHKGNEDVASIKDCYDFEEDTKGQGAGGQFQFMKNAKNKMIFRNPWASNEEPAETSTSKDVLKKAESVGTKSTSTQDKSSNKSKENGELVDFRNDIKYVISGLKEKSQNVQILSALFMSSKCTSAEFRQFCRNHDILDLFLANCVKYTKPGPSLALAQSTIIYLLSRDKGNFHFSQKVIKVITSSIEMEEDLSDEYLKTKEKIKETLREYIVSVNKNNDKPVTFEVVDEKVTPKNLALEALLFISISNSSTKFRDEIHKCGMLGLLAELANDLCAPYKNAHTITSINKFEEKQLNVLLRLILHNSMNHGTNKAYLTLFKKNELISNLQDYFNFLCEKIKVLKEDERLDVEKTNIIQVLLNLTLNLTEENELCCSVIGKSHLFVKNLCCMLGCWTNKYINEKHRFINLMSAAGCVANIVEACGKNRRFLLSETCDYYDEKKKETSVIRIIDCFAKCFTFLESQITVIDENIDHMLDNDIDEDIGAVSDTSDDDLERESRNSRIEMVKLRNEQKEKECNVLFTEVAEKYATSHMEINFLASFVGVNLGLLIQTDEELADSIRAHIPNGKFGTMNSLLQRFLDFTSQIHQNRANSCIRAVSKIIENLEALDCLR
uniref:WAPL domain-containing protein n=1 Tax=Rhabditophanes sp. KR3021 TaxID=114890 RepID=A0AC35U6H5_9BILA